MIPKAARDSLITASVSTNARRSWSLGAARTQIFTDLHEWR